jgi:tetratricopeptide (TPR) repeat protein
MRTSIGITVLLAACAAPAVARAAGEFIEDIQVSRSGDTATVRFELACPMRFRSDLATSAGALIEIRVAPLESCRADTIASEVYRPPGGRLAHVVEVEYEALGLGEHLLVVRFDRPVQYRVSQRGDLRRLELVVSNGAADAPGARADAAPPIAERAAPPPATASASRAPLTLRVREPYTPPDYVVNLQSTRAPPDSALLESISVPRERKVYISSIEIDGAEWHRVRLGFFATETEALAALEPLLTKFPRAWVGRAEAEEVQLAAGFVVARGPAVDAAQAGSRTATESAATPVGAEQAPALLAEGRAALLASDFDRAVRTYSRLLATPAPYGAEAREYLGVARERMGQPLFARAEYERYLADYPDGEGAARVRQRLSGLVTAAQTPREPPPGSPHAHEAERGAWDLSTGLSQYYRRAVDRLDENQAEIVTLSALFTDLDFSVRHSGESLDLRGRVTINQQHDLIGEDSGGPGDRNGVSYAYFDVDSAARDWSLRVGRQTLRSGGVLGRFDGAHAAYEWSDGRRVHFTTGHPVESTRDSINSDRNFYGAAVDFDELIGAWDFSTFVTFGTIEGIEDRRATGLEARYADAARSLTALVDYDVGYSALNAALALGTWRLPNRTTLSALVDVRTSPVLTTRNALIGQPVATIEELLLVWTEDEIRQLARDRSADSRTATLGVAAPIGERFQLNGDVTLTEIGSTVESAGVPAIPSAGAQIYYSGSFVSTGLIGGDVMIFNVRYGESPDFTLSQLTWDARFPIGRSIRINPRLRLAVWEDLVNGRRRETLMPAFRLLLNARNRYRLEIEIGNDRFTRSDGTSDQKATGRFFTLGYRADF